jgi:hypothetical protein
VVGWWITTGIHQVVFHKPGYLLLEEEEDTQSCELKMSKEDWDKAWHAANEQADAHFSKKEQIDRQLGIVNRVIVGFGFVFSGAAITNAILHNGVTPLAVKWTKFTGKSGIAVPLIAILASIGSWVFAKPMIVNMHQRAIKHHLDGSEFRWLADNIDGAEHTPVLYYRYQKEFERLKKEHPID